MKKLKLEELELKSLTTSLQEQSADEVMGGTDSSVTPTIGVSIVSIVSTAVFISVITFGGGGSY